MINYISYIKEIAFPKFIITLILLSGGIYSCSSDNNVIATVGSHKITTEQFEKRYTGFLASTGIKDKLEMRKDILDNMINEIILYYYDDNKDILENPEYQKEMKWFEKEALLAFVKDRDVYTKITATDSELRSAYYKSHVSLAARHLFARTKEEADNLYELLKAGADFKTLAKQVFTDSTLKANGGYLGYFSWGDMDPAFEEAAYKLKPGEISPPVQTAQGYSIIKLEDRKVIPLMTEYDYQKRKKELERSIRISKKRGAVKEFVKKLFDADKLTFNDEALNKLFEILKSKNFVETNLDDNTVLCSYENQNYTVAEILSKIREIPDFHLAKLNSKNLVKKAVEGILGQEKLLQYALDKGYDENPEVQDAIYKLQMNKFLAEKMKEISLNAEIPDSAVEEYYEKNINIFSEPRKINLQEILVKRKELADSLLRLINKGADFGKLAKKFSMRKWTAENNGYLGLSSLDRFGYLKDKLWNAKKNEILGPMEIKGVFGIFRITAKVESKPIPLNKIKEQVTEKAKLDLKTKLVTEYLEKKRKQIDILINKDKLAKLKIS